MHTLTLKRYAAGSLMGIMLLAGAAMPTSTQAQSTSIQAQVQALLAQIAILQAQLNATGGACTTFTADLTLGSSGTNVTALQRFLISKGHPIAAGATGYFGSQTQGALASFQSANGISPAAGYFGAITRARVNAMCVVTPPSPVDNNDDDNNGAIVLRGEASLERFRAHDGEDTNLSEGDEEARVMEVEFDVEDGDIRINRIDVAFDPDSANQEQDPWDVFEEVSIFVDGKRIARVTADNDDRWSEDSPASGDYRIRFSGLDWVVEEGEKAEFEVAVSILGSVRGAPDGASWDIFIPDNGIRGLDADRSSQYIGNTNDVVTFDVGEEGSDDELRVRSSDEDPETTTLALEVNKRSDWQTVFAFDLDTDDSQNDIEVRKLPVEFTFSSSTYAALVHDARLRIGNKTYDDFTVASGTITFEFDRNEFVIDAGDRETVELEVSFKQLASGNEGITMETSINASGIEAEGADDLSGSQLSGTARSDMHTLRTNGASLASKSMIVTYKTNANNDVSDDAGSYVLKFDVTAFNTDIFVARSAERGETMGTAGVNYVVLDASAGGTATTSGSSIASLSANATTEDGYFKVREGETRTFTLTVVFDPELQSFYQVRLQSLNFATSATDPTAQQTALPSSRYESDTLWINN